MRKFRTALLFTALALTSAAALAQTAMRVRGTITAYEGNVLSVKSREGRDLEIELAANATFSYVKALKLEDVKPGTPLGTSAVKGPDGNEAYHIVGSHEADPRKGLVSNESPIGRALIGKRVGHEATVVAPGGSFKVKIVSIT